MKFYINQEPYEIRSILESSDSCSIIFKRGELGLADISSYFEPDTTPEILIYDDEDVPTKLYQNQRVISIYMVSDEVNVTFRADPLEVHEADRLRAELRNAEEENRKLQQRVEEAELALMELAELIAGGEE